MDHTLTLGLDEENTLAELVARAQDPSLDIEQQLASLVHAALAEMVSDHIRRQTTQATSAFTQATPEARLAITKLLSIGTPKVSIVEDATGVQSVTISKV